MNLNKTVFQEPKLPGCRKLFHVIWEHHILGNGLQITSFRMVGYEQCLLILTFDFIFIINLSSLRILITTQLHGEMSGWEYRIWGYEMKNNVTSVSTGGQKTFHYLNSFHDTSIIVGIYGQCVILYMGMICHPLIIYWI